MSIDTYDTSIFYLLCLGGAILSVKIYGEKTKSSPQGDGTSKRLHVSENEAPWPHGPASLLARHVFHGNAVNKGRYADDRSAVCRGARRGNLPDYVCQTLDRGAVNIEPSMNVDQASVTRVPASVLYALSSVEDSPGPRLSYGKSGHRGVSRRRRGRWYKKRYAPT